MDNIGTYLTLAITVIFAENLFFSRGLGSDVIIRVMARPRDFVKFGIILTVMTVISSILGWVIDSVALALELPQVSGRYTGRAIAYLVCIVILYLTVSGILSRYASHFYREIAKVLPIAVFNTAVLGAPLLLSRLRPTLLTGLTGSDFLGAIIFGLSVGIGFLFALVLMSEGLRQFDAMELPAAFSGLPVRFIYIGLLALAFSGIAGRQAIS